MGRSPILSPRQFSGYEYDLDEPFSQTVARPRRPPRAGFATYKSPRATKGNYLTSPASANNRFPRDFWLSPTLLLTRSTPYGLLNEFCARNGFFLHNLTGGEDKRECMFRLLIDMQWPEGHDSYMLARARVRSPALAREDAGAPGGTRLQTTPNQNKARRHHLLGSDVDGAQLTTLDKACGQKQRDIDFCQTTVVPIMVSRAAPALVDIPTDRSICTTSLPTIHPF